MYPISFNNPNKGKNGPAKIPVAANHNGADGGNPTPTDAPQPEDSTPEPLAAAMPEPDETEPGSLLVVECRNDDKWRVVLCTDLAELDGALDTARALRDAPEVDEVCLTLEMIGAHGRETRREVLRFIPEMLETAPLSVPATAAQQVPQDAPVQQPAYEPVMDDGMAVLNSALKMPDYDMDELDFSEFAMPAAPVSRETAPDPSPDTIEADENAEARQRFESEELLNFNNLATTKSDAESARSLLSSLYGGDHDVLAEEKAIRVESAPVRRDHSDWLYRTQPYSGPLRSKNSRLEAGVDDDDDAIDRMETPLFMQQNGLASKMLVFAGTIALLILGGALAELLAVDITTTANAGVGAFDTFVASSGQLPR